MNESGWFSTHAALLLCLLGSVLVTVLPKICLLYTSPSPRDS